MHGNMVQETSARWSRERCRKLLIESYLINFEIILDFLKIQANTAYCYVNDNHF